MRRIRKLYYFDKKRSDELISFLNNNSKAFINSAIFNPLVLIHYLLPLRYKFLPESYVLEDKKIVKGLITVAPSRAPIKKMEIQKLLFEENCYEDAAELVQYAVSKYKAMGTSSFVVMIDDFLPELVKLFITKCGFSQISYEKLWHVHHIEPKNYSMKGYREFRNSDASVVASLYNESLLPHFRPLLSKSLKEFKEFPFQGLATYNEYKFVLEDLKSRNIVACISIQTVDNENYIIDIIQSSWTEIDIDEVIAFANYQINKRQKHFNIFIKTKKYTQIGESQEQEFINHKFECVQNKIVLTNSSAKIIKNEEATGKFTIVNQFYGGIGVVNKG